MDVESDCYPDRRCRPYPNQRIARNRNWEGSALVQPGQEPYKEHQNQNTINKLEKQFDIVINYDVIRPIFVLIW